MADIVERLRADANRLEVECEVVCRLGGRPLLSQAYGMALHSMREAATELSQAREVIANVRDEIESWPTHDELEHGITRSSMIEYLERIAALLPPEKPEEA